MISSQTGNKWVTINMFRMEKDMFIKSCNDLETNYGFKGSRRMSAVEVLGMCLFI